MEIDKTKCPKCGAARLDAEECATCGVIYKKADEALRKKHKERHRNKQLDEIKADTKEHKSFKLTKPNITHKKDYISIIAHAFVFACAIIVAIAYGSVFYADHFYEGKEYKKNNYAKHKKKTYEEMQELAVTSVAKGFVESALKCPSTAKFPYDTLIVHKLHKNYWQVSGLVDAQNSFGAMIRSKWYIELEAIANCNDYYLFKCWTPKIGPIISN